MGQRGQVEGEQAAESLHTVPGDHLARAGGQGQAMPGGGTCPPTPHVFVSEIFIRVHSSRRCCPRLLKSGLSTIYLRFTCSVRPIVVPVVPR